MRKKILYALMALMLAGVSNLIAQTEKTEEQQIAEIIASMPVQPGMTAPDFTLDDIDGKPVSLSNFAGKWVVLDFWGSWCRYCIQGIPEMKDAYEQYHAKGLEILGIDCNEPQENWKAAVAKYELPWVNLYNPAPRGEGVGAQYGILAYPTKILIDPEGKVTKIYLGEDPAFYQLLSDIFK